MLPYSSCQFTKPLLLPYKFKYALTNSVYLQKMSFVLLLFPALLSGMLNKVYALNKQFSSRVMTFFSSKTLVLTGYRFLSSCMRVLHLALLDHSTPGSARF